MTQAVDNAIIKIVKKVQTVSGLKQVADGVPEQIGDDTFAVVYEDGGAIDASPVGTRKNLFNIAVDVVRKRMDLQRDMKQVRPFVDTVSLALLQEISYDSDGNPGSQFEGSIQTFAKINWGRLPNGSDYGGVPVVGYHIVMQDVKILVNL